MRTLKLIGRCQRIHFRDKLSAISVDRFTCQHLSQGCEPVWDIFSSSLLGCLFVWWLVICVLENKFIQTHNLHIFVLFFRHFVEFFFFFFIVCQFVKRIFSSVHTNHIFDFLNMISRLICIPWIRRKTDANDRDSTLFCDSLEDKKKMANGKLIITLRSTLAQKCVKST